MKRGINMISDTWIKRAVILSMQKRAKEILPKDYYDECFSDIHETDYGFACLDDDWYTKLCTMFITGVLHDDVIMYLRVADLAGYDVRAE